jgi:hypothetical protein
MEIEIKCIITNEFQHDGFKLFDINHLESFLQQKFAEKDYGESVLKYFFGFELFKFNGGFAQFFSDDIESWKFKSKWLVINSHFDWNEMIKLNPNEVFENIKIEFLNSADRIENMKRKPKKFDNKALRKDLEEILNQYCVEAH